MSKYSKSDQASQVSKGQEYEINTIAELDAYIDARLGDDDMKRHYAYSFPQAYVRIIGDAFWLTGNGEHIGYEEAYEIINGLKTFYDKINPVVFDELARARDERDAAEAERRQQQPTPPRPRQKRAGYVYLVKSSTGYYKIGLTSNPKDRKRTFSVKLPFEVEFECLIKTSDMVSLERELHGRFADRRVDGEWFDLSAKDVAYIKSLGGES